MKKVGDYEWSQMSMWDIQEKGTVLSYVRSQCGKHIFTFKLRQITEIISSSHYKVKTISSTIGVPDDVLSFRDGDVREIN